MIFQKQVFYLLSYFSLAFQSHSPFLCTYKLYIWTSLITRFQPFIHLKGFHFAYISINTFKYYWQNTNYMLIYFINSSLHLQHEMAIPPCFKRSNTMKRKRQNLNQTTLILLVFTALAQALASIIELIMLILKYLS